MARVACPQGFCPQDCRLPSRMQLSVRPRAAVRALSASGAQRARQRRLTAVVAPRAVADQQPPEPPPPPSQPPPPRPPPKRRPITRLARAHTSPHSLLPLGSLDGWRVPSLRCRVAFAGWLVRAADRAADALRGGRRASPPASRAGSTSTCPAAHYAERCAPVAPRSPRRVRSLPRRRCGATSSCLHAPRAAGRWYAISGGAGFYIANTVTLRRAREHASTRAQEQREPTPRWCGGGGATC